MKRTMLSVLLAALVMMLQAPKASAQNVLFIVDFSGSMNEKVGDRPKIAVAKEVFRNTINTMPSSARVGLMLYGHRRAKDCRDIELISGLGQKPGRVLADQVDQLRARGETPIATALLQSVGVFAKHKGEQNSVVLITDGREECNGDPCAAAEALAAAGLSVKVNVVGFRLKTEARESVACISRLTGGNYFDAQNAGALKAALAQVQHMVTQQPAPAPQPIAPKPPAPPARPNLIAQAEGGELLAAPQAIWQGMNDGKETPVVWLRPNEEGIYGFKDGRSAKFDTFTMFIAGADGNNVKQFELLVGDESPTGAFRSIGKFTTANLRMMKSPYQAFKFPPVTAKYLKVKLLSNYTNDTYIRATEFQLFGEYAAANPAQAATPAAPAAKPRNNLLATSEGGELIAAPQAIWQGMNDGKETPVTWLHSNEEGIYGFKDGKSATFDTFAMFIAGTDGNNVKEFELLVGDESPTGAFRSIGKFTTQNLRMMKSPYQAFKFPPVTAKYLKVKLLGNYANDNYIRATEFQLFGP